MQMPSAIDFSSLPDHLFSVVELLRALVSNESAWSFER
jgi:hypothetical protein